MSGWLAPLDIPVALSREEAQRQAAEELAKAKYGGSPSWLEDAVARAIRVLERLYDLYLRLTGDPTGGGGVNWGFLIAVLVLLLAVGLVVWKVGLPRWRGRTAVGQVELDATTPAADYRALAAAAADRGDWQGAVRDRFRALVRELETRTILQVRPARTAWEAAYSAVRVVPESQPALFDGADLFNRVVYGDEPADPASYARMVAIDDAVLAAADRVDLAAEETVASR
ncbi:MAG: DUF4129 domain-containing protein [Propionibacteriaceae bacterium]